MKIYLQIVFTLFLTSLLIGQTNPVLLRLNPDNSPLPSKQIYCIEIDSSNIVWIGTDRGLAKYDSKSWTIYNTHNGLISNKITAIAFDKNGNVWIIDSVLSKYDGNTWQHFTNQSNPEIPIGSKFLAVDSNNVKWLVKNEQTLVSFDNHSYTDHSKLITLTLPPNCRQEEKHLYLEKT
jgi:ligand-binding sensor domain-containing protein